MTNPFPLASNSYSCKPCRAGDHSDCRISDVGMSHNYPCTCYESDTPAHRLLKEPNAEVTLTLSVNGTPQTFYGRLAKRYRAVTLGTAQGTFSHLPREGSTARTWLSIEHLIATPFRPAHHIGYATQDWQFGLFGVDVCVESAGVTVEPLTDEGREWLRVNESASEKRDRLLARFATFDAEAAEALELTITELVGDAVEDAFIEARDTSGD